jgi:50S ribosomal subunit-associated GTPase HflX
VAISAKSGEGLDDLTNAVADAYRNQCARVELTVCAGNGRLQSWIRAHAIVADESFEEANWRVSFSLRRNLLGKLEGLLDGAEVRYLEP